MARHANPADMSIEYIRDNFDQIADHVKQISILLDLNRNEQKDNRVIKRFNRVNLKLKHWLENDFRQLRKAAEN